MSSISKLLSAVRTTLKYNAFCVQLTLSNANKALLNYREIRLVGKVLCISKFLKLLRIDGEFARIIERFDK